MKLNAVNNNQPRQNNYKNNNNKNTNFTGFADGLVKTWEIIDSSRAIQFTVEDMLGTNFPRTYQGAMAGHEYTGKINWPYLWQEGIREFLTGPTMTLAPLAILGGITKLSGDSANTHKDNIINLSYLADKLPKENIDEKTFRTSFVQKVTEDMLHSTANNADKEDIEELSNGILNYSSLSKAAKTSSEKKAANEALSDLGATFERIVKKTKESYRDTDFQTTAYTTVGDKKGFANFENYVKYTTAYADDYVKTNKGKNGLINLSTSAIDKFKTTWCGRRVLTVGTMIVGTGVLMSFIPKLYTLASGGINPGGAAIYDEAAKREGK